MSETIHITSGMSMGWQVTKPSGMLRWVVPDHTTIERPRLQQLWETQSEKGITHEWRDVPTEVVREDHKAGRADATKKDLLP